MKKHNRELKMFEFNKKEMLEYAKYNIEQNQDFEIEFYIKKFKYNGETIEEIDKEISNWEQEKVLYRDLYYNEKIEKDTNKLKEITDEFIIKDITKVITMTSKTVANIYNNDGSLIGV